MRSAADEIRPKQDLRPRSAALRSTHNNDERGCHGPEHRPSDKPEHEAVAAHDEAKPKDAETTKGKLGRRQRDKELERLHVELVKLQQWVVHKGLRVCIVFEGRDGAGKGGTIKAITERVSPRVFRVVALPRRPSARRARCTCSATCRTCRRPARS